MTAKEVLERLFRAQRADEAWFQPSFLRIVPASKIDEITRGIRETGGSLVEVTPTDDERKLEVTFERARFDVTVVLEDGRISGLFVAPGAPVAESLSGALAPLAALAGDVSYLVRSGDRILAAHRANDALAVGSSFKLAVLAALLDRIAAGARAWDDVVALDPAWRSLPSGVLQDWPPGSRVTVETLASLMISISDNTATDGVMALLGRDALARASGPMLRTGDMFRLKARGNEAVLGRFRSASAGERSAMMTEIEALPLPPAERYPTGVTALDVEWFFSVSELCDLLERVAHLPLMSINPGVAKQRDWDRLAYKGGSEPGVINMSTWASKAGKTYCFSATWNDGAPLDEARFALAYGGVLSFLSAKLP